MLVNQRRNAVAERLALMNTHSRVAFRGFGALSMGCSSRKRILRDFPHGPDGLPQTHGKTPEGDVNGKFAASSSIGAGRC
jgi:hypothetical protein